eukprot:TRINITY_DN3742_c0_g1_i3.p1 TRINITY_DN3742_c0_g1~~TRINITY_DN3742_c0_g1_i3.p1  ORF type:complete len:264 (+),score=33.37 TRINITY_DN3742_c0_g1_i3:150-941(+)
MLLRYLLPGAVKAAHASDRFLVLPVDWSRLQDACDFATVFRGFQMGVAEALDRVGFSAPPPVPPPLRRTGGDLGSWLAEVENICVTAGYRPIHVWDEAPFLFTFDVPVSSPMYVALKPALLDPYRKSVYAMTGTASQVLLRVVADQPPNGNGQWNHTHRIVIPSPHPDYDREEVERAAQQALDLFYKEHPERVARCTVSDIKEHWKEDIVVTPAIAVEVAWIMPNFQSRVDWTADALQRSMEYVRRSAASSWQCTCPIFSAKT